MVSAELHLWGNCCDVRDSDLGGRQCIVAAILQRLNSSSAVAVFTGSSIAAVASWRTPSSLR